MKPVSLFFIVLLLLAFTRCSTAPSEPAQEVSFSTDNEGYSTLGTFLATNPANQQPQTSDQKQGGLVMHSYTDKETGIVSSRFPAPESWKVYSGGGENEPKITGPGNLKVYESKVHTYNYSKDPIMQETYRYFGQPLNPPVGVEGVLQHDLARRLEQEGTKFVKRASLNAATQNYLGFLKQLYVFQQRRLNYTIEGTEWVDKNGNPMFVAIVYLEAYEEPMAVTWMYHYVFLTANADYYQEAKSFYINALEKQEFNPAYIAAQNQKAVLQQQQNQIQTQQSMAAHNQRMRDNQAAFDARQKLHRETYDAINQSSMNAYNNRSASMDRIQNATINSIYEQQNVTNPINGQTYQVEGYSNQYWMNGQGEYIRSDNSLFNPNQQSVFNNQQWEEAVPNPYGE